MTTTIQPAHYNLIIDRISAGRCVPFLGAGVNVSGGDYHGLPLAPEVALHMVKALTDLDKKQLERLTKTATDEVRLRLVQMIADLDDKQLNELSRAEIEQYLSQAEPLPKLLQVGLPDLARVALHVEVETDTDNLMALLREVLPEADCQPSPLLHTLAELPFDLIVTTNYDCLLERAFGDKPYEPVVQRIAGFDEQEQNKLQEQLSNPRGPIIYKIHGSFSDKGPLAGLQASDRLILTEEDYIQFLTVVGREDMGVPALIREKMMGSTILFLGYSLQDWDFRTIYKALIEPVDQWRRPKSFALQKDPPDFWVRYWAPKGITILDVDLHQFADQLQNRWQKSLQKN